MCWYDMSYNGDMNVTIRNMDEELYREVRSRAVEENRTVAEVLKDAMKSYLLAHPKRERTLSLRDWRPVDWGAGTENTSQEIDKILYGEPD